MEYDDKLKLDYKATREYFYHLAETRFKLLAFVPTITGLAVTLLARSASSQVMFGVGVFGWLVSLGIIFYDQRNTQIYDTMVFRAKSLEVMIGLPALTSHFCPERQTWGRGGPFLDRPPRSLRLIRCTRKKELESHLESKGLFEMWHDGGLALIYGAAMAAWTWLAAAGLAQLVFCWVVSPADSPLPSWLHWIPAGLSVAVGVLFWLRLRGIDKHRNRGQKIAVPYANGSHAQDENQASGDDVDIPHKANRTFDERGRNGPDEAIGSRGEIAKGLLVPIEIHVDGGEAERREGP